MHVAFDKRKVECFNCHNTGHFARECKFKSSKDGSKQEASRGQDFKPVRTEKEALMTIDEDSFNALQAKYDELLSEFGDQEAALVAHNSTHYSTCQSNDSDGEQELEIKEWERELGCGYSFERKPCFVCGSLSHLIKDCDYYEKKMAREAAFKSTRVVHANVRQVTPAWTNSNRVNKANQFTPRPVQTSNIRPNFSTASRTIKTGRVNVNTGKQNVSSGSLHVSSGTHIKSGASSFNTGKQHVNSGRLNVNSGTQNKSGGSRVNTGKQNVNSGRVHVNTARVNRPVLSNQTSQVNLKSPKKCFSKQSSPVNRPFSRNTAYKSNIYAVKGKMGTAVKTSAGCVWRKTTPHSNTNSGPTPDSNCFMIIHSSIWRIEGGELLFLEEVKGSNRGKSTIRLGSLVFDDVAFVKELGYFNLFSISQICDKKLNVLFTEKECFVVSSDFKMPDENQVLLKVPRQHNMYTFDMKNVDSSKGYTCLLAKASSNEAKLWHRRLGHLNFKNLNKLVKDNLVRGLPSKSFKNDHTCVACQKGKQHKASCFLLKPTESAGYTEIVDFLRRSKLRYALTHNPPIYDSLVKQFWQTATARTLADGTQQLNATIDSIEYTITEESVRRQLQLADASGINMLQNEEIFVGLQNIGSKSGGWDQFGSNIATALICLSTGRDFNFSKLIFDGMISNLKSKSKFLMYPRFLQMILNETDIQEKDKKKAKNDKAKYENEKSVKRRKSQSQSQPRQSQVKAKSIYNFRN
ncbi:ribonuclease H-like domain-containing protein [Tanacetum coccineum]